MVGLQTFVASLVMALAVPSSMKSVLLIGSATDSMLTKLNENNVHVFKLAEVGIKWLQHNGDQIHYIMTNGHDGVPLDCMPLVPNLKLISCNGVGYDG